MLFHACELYRGRRLQAVLICSVLGLSLTTGAANAADGLDLATLQKLANPFPTANQKPAVDGLNGNIGALGGGFNGGGFGIANGSVAWPTPFFPSIGSQIDGALGDVGGQFYGSIGSHSFWRNPALGLIGIYGSFSRFDGNGGVSLSQQAAEAEAYIGRFTLRGIAGAEYGSSGLYNFGSQKLSVTTRFFDKADAAWFVDEDTSLYIGHRYTGGIDAGAAGVEHLFHMNDVNFSLYAEGRVGENDYKAAWGGIKFYLGNNEKSLIRRSREDDPADWTPDTILSLTKNSRTISPPM